MILADDSPLKRIPAALDLRQAASFDAIRIAVEMADVAYTRLVAVLKGFDREASPVAVDSMTTAAVLLDSWAIVDSLHRLTGTLEQLPRLKKRAPAYQAFIRAMEPATTLRNIVQHFREELARPDMHASPVWGIVTWIDCDFEKNEAHSWSLIPGRVLSWKSIVQNPAGRNYHDHIDHVTIQCQGVTFGISDAMRRLASAVRMMETSLAKSFVGQPNTGGDVFVRITSALEFEAALPNSLVQPE